MRLATVVCLVFLGICSPAWADFDRSRAWFERLSDDDRYSLQANLILLGLYDAFADGKFGNGTYRAITTFQKSTGLSATGVLSSSVMLRLGQLASKVYDEWGFEPEEDASSASTFLLPTRVLSVRKLSDNGSTFSAPDYAFVLETINVPAVEQDFSSLFNELGADLEDRSVTYKVNRGDRFVVAGRDHGTLFYTLFLNDTASSIGFTLRWSADRARDGSIMASYVASHFVPTRWLPAGDTEDATASPSPEQITPEPAPVVEQPPRTVQPTLPAGKTVGAFFIPVELPEVILFSGEIVLGTPLEFLRALRERPTAKLLVLNSPGGLVDSALVMAREIRERGMDTLILESHGCYSACAFMYFGGRARLALGDLGVHQLWSDSNDLVSGQAKISDVVEALDDFGVHRDVLPIMLRTPPDSMHVFTPEEITALGINQGDPASHLNPTQDIAKRELLPILEAQSGTSREASIDSESGTHTRTVSLTAGETMTVSELLRRQNVTPASMAAVAAIFRSEFGVAVLFEGVRATIIIGQGSFGNGDVPHRVELDGLPATFKNATGRATVVLTSAGSYAAER